MRISDWSSDVCSSDLIAAGRLAGKHDARRREAEIEHGLVRAFAIVERRGETVERRQPIIRTEADRVEFTAQPDRQSVVEGEGVSVSVDLGGRRSIKKKINIIQLHHTSTYI